MVDTSLAASKDSPLNKVGWNSIYFLRKKFQMVISMLVEQSAI